MIGYMADLSCDRDTETTIETSNTLVSHRLDKGVPR
jgi:hypothetical protein